MGTQILLVVLLLLCAVVHHVAGGALLNQEDSSKCSCDEEVINRKGFPKGFVFGSASAAYQIEGAYKAKGKGPSMWDNFTHTYPDKIKDQSNGDVAIDSYNLYKEDVKLLKNMGADAYKFSISWSRILPGGTLSEGVSQEGISYYNSLINELLANGVEPWVTLLHLDLPQPLQDAYGGFLSPNIVVKYWITINEPWGLSFLGYTRGIFAPGRCSEWIGNNCPAGDSATEPYNVTHYQLLAHAATVKLYRDKYQELQKGQIGITVNSFWVVPYEETEEHIKAKYRVLDFMLGWVMDPITLGRYPESMTTRVGRRLPKFTKEEAKSLKGSFDFLGVNYYSANYAINYAPNTTTHVHVSYLTDSGAIFTGEKDGVPIGPQGSSKSWYYAYPKGLRQLLRYIKDKYNDPLIYVTENGLDEDNQDDLPISEAMNDYKRKDYFFDHLCCLREAIEQDGANVKGFFAWSLTDNFEWISGYLVRFGIHYVDFRDKSFKRYPKYSATWFRNILGGKIIEEPKSRKTFDH
ncbi:hypothetical protein RD792_002305 [Penstemon davidsonii]|uniref:Beta-glucosidase n=1 Tax=Penstemon davidsonii TaxID=160366 RepID=A0ABR0DQP2_9LAMI|nr:hypothetical protein RD792_002305 [Penstemon davidsonii]